MDRLPAAVDQTKAHGSEKLVVPLHLHDYEVVKGRRRPLNLRAPSWHRVKNDLPANSARRRDHVGAIPDRSPRSKPICLMSDNGLASAGKWAQY
jgi:hypothetical protein